MYSLEFQRLAVLNVQSTVPPKSLGENPFCLFQLLVAPGAPWLGVGYILKYDADLCGLLYMTFFVHLWACVLQTPLSFLL